MCRWTFWQLRLAKVFWKIEINTPYTGMHTQELVYGSRTKLLFSFTSFSNKYLINKQSLPYAGTHTHLTLFLPSWWISPWNHRPLSRGMSCWCNRWWCVVNAESWWHSTPNQLILLNCIHELWVLEMITTQVISRLEQQFHIFP